ncbi:MAG: DUF5597 domain-containing protein [Tepidisphaeraceae bacterium]|jgi:beta-galactosidase GanA
MNFSRPILAALLLIPSALLADDTLPHLQKVGDVTQLFVDGKPYIIFGGQVANASGFPDAMDRAWPKIAALHANTVEFPIYWDTIEPHEGAFDFSGLDQIILAARQHQLHLIPLWFGTWKNGAMDYTPDWIKTDLADYPRVIDSGGKPLDVLSPHGQKTLQADCTAFAALMKHLKEFDGSDHTVIMIQVENESGLLGSVRDYSERANKLFADQVPDEIVTALHKQPGTWKEVFGPALAEESFTAYYLSSYISTVAGAGKKEYPLLMYCNCWMGGDGTNDRYTEFDRPGDSYPSGGPVTHMIDMWKAAAPNIDIIGPDIYHRSPMIYRTILSRYTRADNPLMVVETGGAMPFARYCFYALADFNAIGFTPFGIDGGAPGEANREFDPVSANFRLLAPSAGEIATLQSQGKLKAAVEEESIPGKMLYFDGYDILVRFRPPVRVASGVPLQPNPSPEPSGRVLVGQLGPDEFLIAGFDSAVDFKPSQGSDFTAVQFLHAEQGAYEDGQWTPKQILNGDLTSRGLIFPADGAMIRVKLMRY